MNNSAIFKATVIALSLLLAGCQTGGSGLPGSSGASELHQASSDYRQTVNEGVAVGVIIGTLAGAAIGGARGGGRGAVQGALIGALAGGVLGQIGGTAVANSKAEQVAAEDRLDAEIAKARTANAKLGHLVSVADSLVASRRRELANLGRQSAGSATRERQLQILRELQADRADLDDAIGAAERNRSHLTEMARSFDSRALTSQATAVGGKVAALRSARSSFDAMIGSLK